MFNKAISVFVSPLPCGAAMALLQGRGGRLRLLQAAGPMAEGTMLLHCVFSVCLMKFCN